MGWDPGAGCVWLFRGSRRRTALKQKKNKRQSKNCFFVFTLRKWRGNSDFLYMLMRSNPSSHARREKKERNKIFFYTRPLNLFFFSCQMNSFVCVQLIVTYRPPRRLSRGNLLFFQTECVRELCDCHYFNIFLSLQKIFFFFFLVLFIIYGRFSLQRFWPRADSFT